MPTTSLFPDSADDRVEAKLATARRHAWGIFLPGIFFGASIVFAIWVVVAARDAERTERELLEQRLTTIERTLAELQETSAAQ